MGANCIWVLIDTIRTHIEAYKRLFCLLLVKQGHAKAYGKRSAENIKIKGRKRERKESSEFSLTPLNRMLVWSLSRIRYHLFFKNTSEYREARRYWSNISIFD